MRHSARTHQSGQRNVKEREFVAVSLALIKPISANWMTPRLKHPSCVYLQLHFDATSCECEQRFQTPRTRRTKVMR